ncbi:MAG: FAD-dependent oxidoreductase [Gemmatimonadaceae bacterium]|nr:FAD-dependent oxidoreductase [Gemmatimonadaceae bacterium]
MRLQQRESAQAIVIGGGPAGAATAWALASQGLDVIVLDKARFPRDKPCAEYLSPQGSRILDAMGVLGAVEDAGAAQLSGMRVRSPDGGVIHGEFAAQHGFSGFRDRGLALRRRHLDPILQQAARSAGASIRDGVSLDSLITVGGTVCGVRARVDGTVRELRAPLVIGADGLRSSVSRKLGLQARLPWPRRVAFVAHYRDVSGIGQHGEMHVERDGYVGLADVGHGETNVAIVVPKAMAHDAAGDSAGFMDRWLARHAQLAPRFAGATRTGPVMVTGPFASHARRGFAPGAALVGDAADFFDPFTGEGIYAALRGGELLGGYAADAIRAHTARASIDALKAYDVARAAEFRNKWLVERAIGAAVSSPLLMNHAARVLGSRRDLADLLIGVTGDFVPATAVLKPSFLVNFLDPRRWRSTRKAA